MVRDAPLRARAGPRVVPGPELTTEALPGRYTGRPVSHSGKERRPFPSFTRCSLSARPSRSLRGLDPAAHEAHWKPSLRKRSGEGRAGLGRFGRKRLLPPSRSVAGGENVGEPRRPTSAPSSRSDPEAKSRLARAGFMRRAEVKATGISVEEETGAPTPALLDPMDRGDRRATIANPEGSRRRLSD